MSGRIIVLQPTEGRASENPSENNLYKYSLRESMSATLSSTGQDHYENQEETAVPTITVTFLTPVKRRQSKWLWKRSTEKGKDSEDANV